jgi:hypothetical protein
MEYSLQPYTPIEHDRLHIDPLLEDLSLSTTFTLSIKNLNALPVITSLLDTLALQDSFSRQFRPVKGVSIFLKGLHQPDVELSPVQVHDLELSVQYQMDRPITSQNVEYYQVQLTDLKQKIDQIEHQQRLRDEFTKRERTFKEILNIYGFRDQVLYAQGEHEGLVVFPPLTASQTAGIKVLMLAGNGQIISFNSVLRP